MGKYANMARGGMPGTDQEIEPTTGNRVPPGSLPEEVKDDKTIRVSGGEYIVPADVLQYYGMKFFEDLRAKAKVDLSKMEQTGRIGGQPVPGPQTKDTSGPALPFDDDELLVEGDEAAFAEGGMTEAQIKQPTFTYGSNLNFGGPMRMGGFGTGGGGVETRVYENAVGDKKSILFVNGRPVTQIPTGFYPEGQVPQEAKQNAAVTGTSASGGSEGDMGGESFIDRRAKMGLEGEGGKTFGQSVDYSNWSLDQYDDLVSNRNLVENLAKGAGMLLGPVGLIGGIIVNQIQAEKSRDALAQLQANIEAGIYEGEDLARAQQTAAGLADTTGGWFGNNVADKLFFSDEEKVQAIQQIEQQNPTLADNIRSYAATGTVAEPTTLSWGDSMTTGATGSDLSFGTSSGSGVSSAFTDTYGSTSGQAWSAGEGDLGGGTVRDSFSDTYGSASPSDQDYSMGTPTSMDDTSYYDGSSSNSFNYGGDTYSMGTPVDDSESEPGQSRYSEGGLVKKRAKFKSSRPKRKIMG